MARAARLPEADRIPNNQDQPTRNMLSNPTPHTTALLKELAGLLQETVCPDLEEAEWNHIAACAMHRAEAKLHEDALYNTPLGETHYAFPNSLAKAGADGDSASDADDPAPPSQSAAHRAAKAPKARTPAPPPAPRPKAKKTAPPPPPPPKLKKAAAAGPPKTIRKKRVTKAAKKQKRPLSGYNLFFGAMAPQIREEHPDEDFNERGRIAGGMWTALSDAEKQDWKDKAAEVNARKKAAAEAQAAAMALQEEESSGEEEEAESSGEEEDDE